MFLSRLPILNSRKKFANSRKTLTSSFSADCKQGNLKKKGWSHGYIKILYHTDLNHFSKALDVCQAQNEFEGSCERVEFERLLLEAHHKYAAASAEINRIKSRGAKAGLVGSKTAPISKGSVSISGLSLQLKPEFVKLLSARDGPYLHVHYFVCLVKYRSQVRTF